MFATPTAGVLVSNPVADAAPIASPANADVTERVRVPRAVEDTALVPLVRKSRAPLFIGLAVALAGAGVAAFIAFGGSGSITGSTTTAAPAAAKTDEPSADEPKGEVGNAEATTEAPKAEEPGGEAKANDLTAEPKEPEAKASDPTADPKITPETKKVEPAVAAVPPEPAIDPERAKIEKRPPAKTVKKAPAKKLVKKPPVEKKEPAVKKPAKTEPKKETEWNADSPFLPVRQ
jgi:hypothetical protein